LDESDVVIYCMHEFVYDLLVLIFLCVSLKKILQRNNYY